MKKDRTYAGIPLEFSGRSQSRIFLQSIPYDGTSTWGKGADRGFEAFMNASDNLELYDIETDSEVYRHGIHLLDESPEFDSPEKMFQYTYANTKKLLREGKFLTFFGGEHSISIGIIKAHYQHFEDLSILQIDAHADLRPSYEGSPYNHACALFDASQNANLVQVGIRSMDISEKKHLNYEKMFFAHQIMQRKSWVQEAINQLSNKVYITFDLDALDPGIMPATGTPEPGGLDWYSTTAFLKRVFEEKNVVGFDMVELAPIEGFHAPQFTAAKLYYKMLSYKFGMNETDG